MHPQQDAHSALGALLSQESQQASAQACFAADLPVFAGHFPDNPLVPGVHQLALVLELFRHATAHSQAHILAIERCKWLHPLRPNEQVLVSARWQELHPAWRIDGSLEQEGNVLCRCRLRVDTPR